MRPRKPFFPGAVKRLNTLMNSAKNVAEFKRLQSVWLRAALDMPLEQIAQATGLASASVRCYHSRYIKGGESVLLGPGRGGRRRQNLSVAQESELLSGFEAQAMQGGGSADSRMQNAMLKSGLSGQQPQQQPPPQRQTGAHFRGRADRGDLTDEEMQFVRDNNVPLTQPPAALGDPRDQGVEVNQQVTLPPENEDPVEAVTRIQQSILEFAKMTGQDITDEQVYEKILRVLKAEDKLTEESLAEARAITTGAE